MRFEVAVAPLDHAAVEVNANVTSRPWLLLYQLPCEPTTAAAPIEYRFEMRCVEVRHDERAVGVVERSRVRRADELAHLEGRNRKGIDHAAEISSGSDAQRVRSRAPATTPYCPQIRRSETLRVHVCECRVTSSDRTGTFVDRLEPLLPPDAPIYRDEGPARSIQTLDRAAPGLSLFPGTPERRTDDDVRNGTTNVYAALDGASGNVISDLTPHHCGQEFRRFLNLIDATSPASRCRRRRRSPRDRQDLLDPTLALATSTIRVALHTDVLELAQPRERWFADPPRNG